VRPRPTTTRSNPRGRQLLLLLVAVLLVVGIFRAFRHHENSYEKLARGVTIALQSNNVDEVKKYQNAETATLITRGIVGRAADKLAPLGKLKSVKEVTPTGSPDRTHEFDVTFDKGVVHEKLKVDPDNKIVHFTWDKVSP
jgi:hypothetical protein